MREQWALTPQGSVFTMAHLGSTLQSPGLMGINPSNESLDNVSHLVYVHCWGSFMESPVWYHDATTILAHLKTRISAVYKRLSLPIVSSVLCGLICFYFNSWPQRKATNLQTEQMFCSSLDVSMEWWKEKTKQFKRQWKIILQKCDREGEKSNKAK